MKEKELETQKKLFHTEVRKPQFYRNIIREQWFKKNGRPVIGIDRACTLTRVHERIRDRNNMEIKERHISKDL